MKDPWSKKRTAVNGMITASVGLLFGLILLIAQIVILAVFIGTISLVAFIVSFLFNEEASSELPYHDPENFDFETGKYTIS